RVLALHHGYCVAVHNAAGPTAWLAPAYPLVVAAVFSVFGIQSHAAAVVLLILNCAVSLINYFGVLKSGTWCFSERVGLLGAILWAVSPTAAVTELILWD